MDPAQDLETSLKTVFPKATLRNIPGYVALLLLERLNVRYKWENGWNVIFYSLGKAEVSMFVCFKRTKL